MKINLKSKLFLLATFISMLAFLLYVIAADHSEAPATIADQAADIADVYAWYEGNKLITALTFAGLATPVANQAGNYDENVLYQVHIDNNDDNNADINIEIRFGQDADNNWGVQVKNLPGVSGVTSGPVDTVLSANNNYKVYAGLTDDPFFFDLDGFRQTLDSGTLSFDSNRDSIKDLNSTAIVLEMDLAAARSNGDKLNIWATTGRK